MAPHTCHRPFDCDACAEVARAITVLEAAACTCQERPHKGGCPAAIVDTLAIRPGGPR